MAKNIQINYNNGNGYEVLHPENVLANITDWASSIYSKSEVDNLVKNAGKFKTVTGKRKGTGTFPANDTGSVFSVELGFAPFLFGLGETGHKSINWPTYNTRGGKYAELFWPWQPGIFFFSRPGVLGDAGSSENVVGNGWATSLDYTVTSTGVTVSLGYLYKDENNARPSDTKLISAVYNTSNRTYYYWALGLEV